MLQNHKLIFDNECPMCNIYTHAFEKNKLLEKGSRVNFTNYALHNEYNIDMDLAKNKIALINTQTKEVIYGIDSLILILGYKFTWIKKLFRINIFYKLIAILYNFVSFNRKVVAPSKTNSNVCEPSFNLKYRILFIIFCIIITSIILNKFTNYLPFKNYPFFIETVFLLLQIPFQNMFLFGKSFETKIIYFGHLLFLSMLGSLLLVPIIVVNMYFQISIYIYLAYFFIIVYLLIYWHFKRVKILGLNKYLTASWILYRLFILIYILKFSV